MKTITVQTTKPYPVIIGSNILPTLGQQVAQICAGTKAAIISDTNVWPLYGSAVQKSLKEAGLTAVSYVFPAGEKSKNGRNYLNILDFLATNQLTRSDCIIALGGGVVGDISGFAAATYLRGISYIQIPTTLLAAVDSSVGGKTAIDLTAGKNLAGAFCQPKLVLCDTDTLSTLPEDIFRDGCAEVIKYAVLFERENVIARCIQWKAQVVEKDELDLGERMKLNLGHTMGHGIEILSNFSLSHGKAVAIGLAMICRGGHLLSFCDKYTQESVINLLGQFQRAGDTVHLIVPKNIGNCIIHPIEVPQLKSFIEAGM